MSIHNKVKIINRVEKIASSLQEKYAQDSMALDEFNKLQRSLKELATYLNKLDELRPNYNTNEINPHIDAINVHVDILKSRVDSEDYLRLRNGVRAIKISLKFHPTKYSFFTFIVDWFIEWMYFI